MGMPFNYQNVMMRGKVPDQNHHSSQSGLIFQGSSRSKRFLFFFLFLFFQGYPLSYEDPPRQWQYGEEASDVDLPEPFPDSSSSSLDSSGRVDDSTNDESSKESDGEDTSNEDKNNKPACPESPLHKPVIRKRKFVDPSKKNLNSTFLHFAFGYK